MMTFPVSSFFTAFLYQNDSERKMINQQVTKATKLSEDINLNKINQVYAMGSVLYSQTLYKLEPFSLRQTTS